MQNSDSSLVGVKQAVVPGSGAKLRSQESTPPSFSRPKLISRQASGAEYEIYRCVRGSSSDGTNIRQDLRWSII